MDTYLITGVSGFVGNEVARKLLENGDSVTAVGRHKPNLAVEYINADICDTASPGVWRKETK